jgi:hypothetical protein
MLKRLSLYLETEVDMTLHVHIYYSEAKYLVTEMARTGQIGTGLLLQGNSYICIFS